MESVEDRVRVKKEPNCTCPDAGNDRILELVNFDNAKNVEESTFHKSSANYMNEAMALQEQLDGQTFANFESKNFKPNIKSPSTTIVKSEYQNIQPIVKIENDNQIVDMKEKIFIDFEGKDVNFEQSLSTIISKTEHQNCLSFVKIENRNQINVMNEHIFIDFVENNRSKPFEL
ncbi:hypothetical protein TKK_0012059 [Trichogramma kaykai]